MKERFKSGICVDIALIKENDGEKQILLIKRKNKMRQMKTYMMQ